MKAEEKAKQHSSTALGIVQALGELLKSGLGKSQSRSPGSPTRWPPDKQQSGRADTARCVGVYGETQNSMPIYGQTYTHTHTLLHICNMRSEINKV